MWALDDAVSVDLRAAVPRRVLEEAESRAGEVEFGMRQEALDGMLVARGDVLWRPRSRDFPCGGRRGR